MVATLTHDQAVSQYKQYVENLQTDYAKLTHGLEKFLKDAAKTAENLDRAKEKDLLDSMDV